MFPNPFKNLGDRSVKLSQLAGVLLVFGVGMLAGVVLLDALRAHQRAKEAEQLCSDEKYVGSVHELLTRELVYHGLLPSDYCLDCGDPAQYALHHHRDRIEPDCGIVPAEGWPSGARDPATVVLPNQPDYRTGDQVK